MPPVPSTKLRVVEATEAGSFAFRAPPRFLKSWAIQPGVLHIEGPKTSRFGSDSRSSGQTIGQTLDLYFRQAVTSSLHFRQTDASNLAAAQNFGVLKTGLFFSLAAIICFQSRQTNASSHTRRRLHRPMRLRDAFQASKIAAARLEFLLQRWF